MGSGNLDAVNAKWDTVLALVKKRRPSAHTLLAQARISRLNGQCLILVAPNPTFAGLLMRKDDKALLERALEKAGFPGLTVLAVGPDDPTGLDEQVLFGRLLGKWETIREKARAIRPSTAVVLKDLKPAGVEDGTLLLVAPNQAFVDLLMRDADRTATEKALAAAGFPGMPVRAVTPEGLENSPRPSSLAEVAQAVFQKELVQEISEQASETVPVARKRLPLTVFVSYSHKDKKFREELKTHLASLEQDGLLSTWHDGLIKPGSEWDETIRRNLDTAGMILLLISADFIASNYCRGVEMTRALERYEAHEALVVPIIVRNCYWHSQPFAKLQALPDEARPIASWPDRDDAYTSVAINLRQLIEAEFGA